MSQMSNAIARFDKAAEHHIPLCLDDPRFTDDNPTQDVIDLMSATCNRCPLIEECRHLAAVLKPGTGHWAGTQRRTYNKTRQPDAEAS